MGEKVTLKQIAELAGVSLTTVHRVLNGKEGCSEEVKQRVLQIAKEQGYSVNLAASTLRKSTIHIALLFPENEDSSRFFLQRMLNGYLQARGVANQYNVVFQEYYTSVDNSGNNSVTNCLKQIYRDRPVHFDGLIIYGLNMLPQDIAIINRIIGSKTPVVILEHTPAGLEDICSVEVNDEIAANLAAELLSKFIHSSGTVLLLNQYLIDGDKNGRIFTQSLGERRPDLTVHSVDLALNKDQTQTIAQLMDSIPDLVGVYATCARHTASMLHVVERFPRVQATIGSELFAESYEALQKGTLDAVIDKRPEKLGYLAAITLIDHLVKNAPMQSIYRVTPRIVLQSNSEIYYKKKEKPYESSYE